MFKVNDIVRRTKDPLDHCPVGSIVRVLEVDRNFHGHLIVEGYEKAMGLHADWFELVETGRVSALDTQEGGDHYKLAIQPAEFITKNNLGFIEGNIIKYATRHRTKNGKEDIKKLIHYAELLLELEYKE